jgi:hypothetical protein
MITNIGKKIIGKYLLGTAPSYASYIAIGCGPKPGSTNAEIINQLPYCFSEYWLVEGDLEGTDYNANKIFISTNAPTSIDDLTDNILGKTVSMVPATVSYADPFDNNGRFSQEGLTSIEKYSNNDHPKDISCDIVNDFCTLGNHTGVEYKSIIVDVVPEEFLYQGNINVNTTVDKVALDFEMFRVPISSKGYITEDGVDKMLFAAELPSEERYEITEVGLYSAESNTQAGNYDSKILFSFSDQENWQLNTENSTVSSSTDQALTNQFPIITEKFTGISDDFIERADNAIAIQTTSDNDAFLSTARLNRFERTRFLNSTYLLNGGASHILNDLTFTGTITSTANETTITGIVDEDGNTSTNGLIKEMKVKVIGGVGAFGSANLATIKTVDSSSQITIKAPLTQLNTTGKVTFVVPDSNLSVKMPSGVYPSFLQLNAPNLDLSKNSGSDLLKIAFSIVNKDTESGDPDAIRLFVKFSDATDSQFAQFSVDVLAEDYNGFTDNRYIVIEKMLNNLEYSNVFSWLAVTKVSLYANAIKNIEITNKQLTDNVATLTSVSHGLYPGDFITVYGVDSIFNGTYEITDTPDDNTFKYAKTNTNVSSTAVTGGSAESSTREFWIALDGMRLENVSSINPLYGLVGYSIVDGTNTIIKSANTTNYIEFRFALNVL